MARKSATQPDIRVMALILSSAAEFHDKKMKKGSNLPYLL
jgi:hypothetical protein